MHELEQSQYATLKGDLRLGLKSLETMTLNFCDAFERPSAAGREPDKRIAYARDCLAILMRDAPSPLPTAVTGRPSTAPIAVPPIPSMSSLGACQMPIELILQLVAPLAENLVSGLLKGVLTHVQANGLPASPALPAAVHPVPAPAAPGLTAADFVAIAKMIEDAISKLQTAKQ
jgi:hypothetical protein